MGALLASWLVMTSAAHATETGAFQKMQGKDWFRGAKKMIAQAKSQFDVAGETPIRWHFAESEVADLMRIEFRKGGFTSIKIVHTPVVP